eukprot:1680571-Prymnesium_polylepis.1
MGVLPPHVECENAGAEGEGDDEENEDDVPEGDRAPPASLADAAAGFSGAAFLAPFSGVSAHADA